MIPADNLAAAVALVEALRSVQSIRDRLTAGEEMHLILGKGEKASELVLGASYADGIRRDLITAFTLKIDGLEEDLRAMGVTP